MAVALAQVVITYTRLLRRAAGTSIESDNSRQLVAAVVLQLVARPWQVHYRRTVCVVRRADLLED